jgi:hypothetical protein
MINLILSFRKPHPEVETDANSGMTLLASDCLFRAFSGEEVWRRSAGFRVDSTLVEEFTPLLSRGGLFMIGRARGS